MTANEPTRLQQLEQENATLRAELADMLNRNGQFRSDMLFAIAGTREGLPDAQIAETAKSVRAEVATLRELAEGLANGLACALRQWQSYAQDDDGHDLETSGHLEGRIYRIHAKSLKDYRAACPWEGK
jgi:hypothetical protein